MPRFSICIPNFNYGAFLGETIRSVLDQDVDDLEVLVSDNASTDDSVDVVRSIDDDRIRLQVNRTNVGFAGNLDRVGAMATGEVMVMLSSDDLMLPGALRTYGRLLDDLGERADRTVISSAVDVIDADGATIGFSGSDPAVWGDARRLPASGELPAVLEVGAADLLGRCLATMRNPFHFAATAYPRSLYEAVGGYGGGRLVNPDKWFHWLLLGAADTALFVESARFAYRWHASNQTAQQEAQGALKYLVDDYRATFEAPDALLRQAGTDRQRLVHAYVEHDIARHGLATLARGGRTKARRIAAFGRAAYPDEVRRNRRAWALRGLLALGPVGERVAATAYARTGERRRPPWA